MSEINYKTKVQKKQMYKNRGQKLISFRDIQALSEKLKKEGKNIVFTLGSFDLLNPGHCRYLAEAKAQGDILVVGVSSDASLKRTKGEDFSLVNEEVRAELISQLRIADYVTIVDEDRPHALLILLKPDVYFTSQGAWDDGTRDKYEEILVKSYGGIIIKRERHKPYFGTNSLAEHIANIRVIQTLESYLKDKIDGFILDPLKHLKPADFGKQIPVGRNAFNPRKRVLKFNKLAYFREAMKKKGLTVSFVAGSFDLLHVGHARFIEQAGLHADVLVVGLPSDTSLRLLKGIGRPVINEYARAYVLGHLEVVDHVVIFNDKTIYSTLESLKPDVFFTVEESWNNFKESKEFKFVKSYGGKVVSAEFNTNFPTQPLLT
ncbi:MAG: adenylyltransferase/cytidyltransferase family protein [Patescibacteria group bacterium]